MLGVLLSIVIFLMLIIALIIVLLVLFQDNKGGLTGALGSPGAESALGAKATEKISKLTAYFVTAFMTLTLVAAVIQIKRQKPLVDEPAISKPGETKPAADQKDAPAKVAAPAVPAEGKPE